MQQTALKVQKGKFQMKKKISLLLALSLLATMILASCAPAEEAAPADSEAPAAEDSADDAAEDGAAEEMASDYSGPLEGDVLIWTFDAPFVDMYEWGAESNLPEGSNLNLTVELLEYDALYEKFNTVLLAGGTDGPDIIDVEESTFGTYTKGEVPFLDLGPYIEASGKTDDIVAGRIAQYTYDGKAYGVPRQLVPVTLVLNTELLDEAGISYPFETWEDFTAAGMEYHAATGNYFLGTVNTAGTWKNNVEVLLKSTGVQMVTETGEVSINTDEFKEISEMYRDWFAVENVGKIYENWTDYWAAPATGEMCAFIVADWTAGRLKEGSPDLTGLQHFELPKLNENTLPTSSWGGTCASISMYSENPDLAWQFINNTWVDTDFGVNLYTSFGNVPAIHSALSDERIQGGDEYYGGQDVIGLYAELADILPPTYQSWWRPNLAEAMEQSWAEFYDGTIDVEQFATDTEQFILDIIADNQ